MGVSRDRERYLDALVAAGWTERDGSVVSPHVTIWFKRNPDTTDGFANTATLPELLPWLQRRGEDIARYLDHPEAQSSFADNAEAIALLAAMIGRD